MPGLHALKAMAAICAMLALLPPALSASSRASAHAVISRSLRRLTTGTLVREELRESQIAGMVGGATSPAATGFGPVAKPPAGESGDSDSDEGLGESTSLPSESGASPPDGGRWSPPDPNDPSATHFHDGRVQGLAPLAMRPGDLLNRVLSALGDEYKVDKKTGLTRGPAPKKNSKLYMISNYNVMDHDEKNENTELPMTFANTAPYKYYPAAVVAASESTFGRFGPGSSPPPINKEIMPSTALEGTNLAVNAPQAPGGSPSMPAAPAAPGQ